MTKVKEFIAPSITDEYGGKFPQAYVAVWDWSESSQRTGTSKEGETEYDVSLEVEAISYKWNYWYNQSLKGNLPSRPAKQFIDGEFTSVFTVDLENPAVINILNGTGDPETNILNAIEFDIKTRFK